MAMTREAAETLALRALAFVAADEDLAPRFAGATGADLAGAAERVDDPSFLAGILEFLTMEDRWIQRFCDAEGLAYDAPLRALAALPGGMRPEWP